MHQFKRSQFDYDDLHSVLYQDFSVLLNYDNLPGEWNNERMEAALLPGITVDGAEFHFDGVDQGFTDMFCQFEPVDGNPSTDTICIFFR